VTVRPADSEHLPWADEMSEEARKAFPVAGKGAAKEWPDEMSGPMYCAVKSPDGEFPTAHVFQRPESLARFVSALDGQDVCVWIFYGLPVPVTKGPNRALILPDDTYLPLDETVQRFEADPDTLEIQEDGFLGPEALSISTTRSDDPGAATQGSSGTEDSSK
jgi:hypothetical protein